MREQAELQATLSGSRSHRPQVGDHTRDLLCERGIFGEMVVTAAVACRALTPVRCKKPIVHLQRAPRAANI